MQYYSGRKLTESLQMLSIGLWAKFSKDCLTATQRVCPANVGYCNQISLAQSNPIKLSLLQSGFYSFYIRWKQDNKLKILKWNVISRFTFKALKLTWMDLPSLSMELPDRTQAPDLNSVALDGRGTSKSSGSHGRTPWRRNNKLIIFGSSKYDVKCDP